MKTISRSTENKLNRRGFRELNKGQFCNKDCTLCIYLWDERPDFQININSMKSTYSEYFNLLHKLKLQIIEILEILETDYGDLRKEY